MTWRQTTLPGMYLILEAINYYYLPGCREKTKPRVRMTRSPKAETSRSGSLAVSTKMKIAIAATTPMDKTSELKIELIKKR